MQMVREQLLTTQGKPSGAAAAAQSADAGDPGVEGDKAADGATSGTICFSAEAKLGSGHLFVTDGVAHGLPEAAREASNTLLCPSTLQHTLYLGKFGDCCCARHASV